MKGRIFLSLFFILFLSLPLMGEKVEKERLPFDKAKKVIEKAGGEPDFRIRLSAVRAVSPLPSLFLPFLLRMTEDREEVVRAEAVRVFSYLEPGEEKVISRLSLLAKNDGSWLVRYHALLALSKLSPGTAFPIARSFARSSEYQLKIASCYTLSPNKGKYPLAPLKKLIKHPDFRVRTASYSALLEAGDKKAETELKKLLSSKEPEVRRVVILLIGERGGGKGLNLIENMKKDKSARVREALASALKENGRWGKETAKRRAEILAFLISDKKPEVRLTAISSLSSLKRKEDILLFNKALADPEWRIITEAIKALSLFSSPMVAKALTPFLNHPSPLVRGETAFAMGVIGAKEKIPQLRELLSDREREVRIKASVALALLGDEKGMRRLNNLLTKGNKEEQIISSSLIIKAIALTGGETK